MQNVGPVRTSGFALTSLARPLVLVLLAVCAAGAGCARRELMPTPNLYVHAEVDPFADVVQSRRTPTVDLLYVTDRTPVSKDGALRYGYGRSPSVAYGSCMVEIGKDLTWEQLVAESRVKRRTRALPLSVLEVRELGRFPPTPRPLARAGKRIVEDPEAIRQEEQSAAALQEELRRRLAETPRKEAFVFVHGYNNTFDDASFAAAELWHFLAREGVFIMYTWPAGSPGLLRGYTHDRESGEFTLYHLKQFLRALAGCEEAERISVIAHSRGNDVAGSALRELFIETRAAGKDPRETWRIHNLMVAAPDLDVEVFSQRFTTERFPLAVDRGTLYVSSKDKALGVADWLFNSERRLGQMRLEDLPPQVWKSLEQTPNTAIVDSRIKKADKNLHSYFRTNPSTSSDVILFLRYDRDPGPEHGRPLIKSEKDFWILNEGYPGDLQVDNAP